MYLDIQKLLRYKNVDEVKRNIIQPYKQLISKMEKVYIWGGRRIGDVAYKSLCRQGYNVLGYIDNNVQIQGNYINGIRVYGLQEIVDDINDATIIICSLLYGPEIEEQLRKEGIKTYIHYSILNVYSAEAFPMKNPVFEGLVESLIINKEDYLNVFQALADEKSKIIYNKLIKFRSTLDFKYAIEAFNFSGNELLEYFDHQLISLNNQEVFIDGGAYKGETSVQFIKEVNDRYQQIYLFEPDLKLLNEAKEQLHGKKNIVYINGGLGKTTEKIRFSSTGDMGGNFSEEGDSEVNVYALDEIVQQKVTFIKLDVEGFEKEAILGAQKIIRENAPILAISAYHKPEDIWELYKAVMNINSNYKVYLRHYSKGYYETDLYFIPDNKNGHSS